MVIYSNDIVQQYSDKRPTVTEQDAQDLMRCLIMWLNKKFKEEDFNSIEFRPMGTFYKPANFKKIMKKNFFNDQLIIQELLNGSPKKYHTHNQNNHPIKNS